MPLPYGTWKALVNGVEGLLFIDPPDAQGIFVGRVFGSTIKGFWNEAAQKIQFSSYAEPGAGAQTPVFGIFEGYLFRSPVNPNLGQDVTVTLVGSVLVSAQAINNNVLPEMTPSSRRSTFGWMAQIADVQ